MDEKFKIRRLIPIVQELSQCQVMRATGYANDTTETDMTCTHRAVIEINGTRMCRKHAGAVALDILLSQAGQ